MIIFLNKLPIPNLKHYSLFSFGLLAIVLLYSQKLFYELKNNSYKNEKFDAVDSIEQNGLLFTTYKAVTHESWCILTLINFCYCGILLISRIIQGFVFGKLRAVENQHIKDHFWNFIFLKFIFIFGVLNLENVNEVILWCTWFSVIGFLAIHCQICKDRFEYLSFSTTTPLRNHVKVFLLLLFIQILCFGLIGISFVTQQKIGIGLGLFMFAEAFGLTLRTFYVITRYVVHLWDIYNLTQWNNKGTIVYYVDFMFETAVVSIEFLHYLHMLIYGNFYLSMASLVICMELKRLFFDLKRRMKRHSNYLKVIEKMEKRFPWATSQELENSDKCAVCWDKLENARRLPCSHIFHHNCLRSWLEQDTSCPTCRKSLQDEKDNQSRSAHSNAQAQPVTDYGPANGVDDGGLDGPLQQQQQQQQPAPQQAQFVNYQRNLFHFDGSRYISWLPSFSLQVTNGGNIMLPMLRNRSPIEPERLNEMTQQISQMFPNISIEAIQNNLRQTHSIELTIENFLQDPMTVNNNNRNNLLNNDDSDENNESEEDDVTSSDEDSINHQAPFLNNETNLNNNGGNGVESSGSFHELRLRHSNLFSSLLGRTTSRSSSNQTMQSSLNTNNNDYQINQRTEAVVASSSTPLLENDDSLILSKYSTSPKLSENANNLIQRKRNLILDSKKRFLEKSNKLLNNQLTSSSNQSENGISSNNNDVS